ncbi:hypothetical protein ACQ4PT_007512 [Festuca glaucescens]
MDKLGGGVGPDAEAGIDVFKVSSEAAKGMGSFVAEAGKVLVNSLGGTLQAARGPDEEAVVTGPFEATEVVVNPETLLVVGGSAEEAVATADFEARGVMSESLPKTKEVAKQAVMTGSEEEALLDSAQILDSDRYASLSSCDFSSSDDLEGFLLSDTTASADVRSAIQIAEGMIVPPCFNDLTSNPNESEIMEQGVTVSVTADLVHHPTEPLIREQGDATSETADHVQHATETLIREQGDATSETADHVQHATETLTQDEEVITPTVSESMQQEPQSGLRITGMFLKKLLSDAFCLSLGHSVLANVEEHEFANVSELSESINNNDGRLTKKQALALLHNGEMFQIGPAIQSDQLNLAQGGVITIAGNRLPDFPVTAHYHMAGKILKERVPIQLHVSDFQEKKLSFLTLAVLVQYKGMKSKEIVGAGSATL